MKKIFASIALTAAILFGSVMPAHAAAVPQKIIFAQAVVDQVNQERANNGLQPLAVSEDLCVMANDKAIDMYWNHYFGHTSPYYGDPFHMMDLYGINHSYAGENIAKGQRTPKEVMTAWMNSAGHRQNILNPNFDTIGVAYYKGEWVQEFIQAN